MIINWTFDMVGQWRNTPCIDRGPFSAVLGSSKLSHKGVELMEEVTRGDTHPGRKRRKEDGEGGGWGGRRKGR